MGWHAVISSHRLDRGLILAPERYDPRRTALAALATSVGDVADICSVQVTARSAGPSSRFLIFNTGDAQEGILISRPTPVAASGIGSSKKVLRPGDVVISRLRPYLRQVAYVDEGLSGLLHPGAVLLCSTEFYVLRPRDQESIAYLVPFLLSDRVQEILCAAQEGGHHPRFNQRTLENLGLPESLLANRGTVAASVETAVGGMRAADATMRELIGGVWKDGA